MVMMMTRKIMVVCIVTYYKRCFYDRCPFIMYWEQWCCILCMSLIRRIDFFKSLNQKSTICAMHTLEFRDKQEGIFLNTTFWDLSSQQGCISERNLKLEKAIAVSIDNLMKSSKWKSKLWTDAKNIAAN